MRYVIFVLPLTYAKDFLSSLIFSASFCSNCSLDFFISDFTSFDMRKYACTCRMFRVFVFLMYVLYTFLFLLINLATLYVIQIGLCFFPLTETSFVGTFFCSTSNIIRLNLFQLLSVLPSNSFSQSTYNSSSRILFQSALL